MRYVRLVTRQSVLESLLAHKYLFKKAFIFGSVARDECDEFSDADILFVRDTRVDFFHRVTELMDIMLAVGDVDAMIYTPEEFELLKKTSGFIQIVIEEAIEVEGEQTGSR